MEFKTVMGLRKSARAYSDKKVSDEQIRALLEAGSMAPVGRAMYETLHYTVITDGAVLKEMSDKALEAAGNVGGNSPLYGAPAFILVSTKTEMANNLGIANASCVIDHMHMAAVDMGLASCYIWGCVQPFKADPEMAKIFKLPEGFTPVAGLIVGYAAEADQTERPMENKIATDYIC